MRYELVTETFPPEVNGVAMTLRRLMKGIAKRGHQVAVIRPNQGKQDKPGQSTESDPESFDEVLMPGGPLPGYAGLHFGWPAYFKLKRRWSAQRPDLIHVATEGPIGITAVWAARKLGIPCTSSFHTNFHSYGDHYGYGFFKSIALGYLRYVHNQTLATFPPSTDLIDTLTQDGFNNLHLLGRGVDTTLFNPFRRDPDLRRSWGITDDKQPIAIYVGRIAGEKNIPLVVDTYVSLKKEHPELKLVVVGDGPEKKRLQQQHPEIIFPGLKQGEELARHYASGDLFLFASITETFGNVVTEALASGLVAITYDYAAGQRYIKHGENGYLAKFDNAGDFLKISQQAMNEQTRWADIRTAAHDTAKALSWDNVIDGYLDTLEQITRDFKGY